MPSLFSCTKICGKKRAIANRPTAVPFLDLVFFSFLFFFTFLPAPKNQRSQRWRTVVRCSRCFTISVGSISANTRSRDEIWDNRNIGIWSPSVEFVLFNLNRCIEKLNLNWCDLKLNLIVWKWESDTVENECDYDI